MTWIWFRRYSVNPKQLLALGKSITPHEGLLLSLQSGPLLWGDRKKVIKKPFLSDTEISDENTCAVRVMGQNKGDPNFFFFSDMDTRVIEIWLYVLW